MNWSFPLFCGASTQQKRSNWPKRLSRWWLEPSQWHFKTIDTVLGWSLKFHLIVGDKVVIPQDIGKRYPISEPPRDQGTRSGFSRQGWQFLRVLLRFLLVSILRSVGMCPFKLSCFNSPGFDYGPYDWDGHLHHQQVNRPRQTQRPQRRCQQQPSKQKGRRHESYALSNMKTFANTAHLKTTMGTGWIMGWPTDVCQRLQTGRLCYGPSS